MLLLLADGSYNDNLLLIASQLKDKWFIGFALGRALHFVKFCRRFLKSCHVDDDDDDYSDIAFTFSRLQSVCFFFGANLARDWSFLCDANPCQTVPCCGRRWHQYQYEPPPCEERLKLIVNRLMSRLYDRPRLQHCTSATTTTLRS